MSQQLEAQEGVTIHHVCTQTKTTLVQGTVERELLPHNWLYQILELGISY